MIGPCISTERMNTSRIESANRWRRLPPSRVAESEPRRKSGVFLCWGTLRGATDDEGRAPGCRSAAGTIRAKDCWS